MSAGTRAEMAPGLARLGIDVGGTKAALAVGGADGEMLARTRFEGWSRGRWSEDLAALIARAGELLGEAGVSEDALAAVGVSAPGPLDIPAGRIVDAHNIPGWTDVPVVQELQKAFGVPVVLENDANTSALAEWRHGAGRGTDHMIFLTMSSGVGGGLILDGRLYRGQTLQAGEVGHMPIQLGGRPCTCGLRGCLEAYTSGHALARIIKEDLASGASSSMVDAVEGDLERIDARVWVSAVRAGDTYALELRERFLDRLAQGLAMLIPTFDPQCIVLGTIIHENPDLFLEALRSRVLERTWSAYHHTRIEAGELGAELPFYAGLCAAGLVELQAPGSR